MLYCFDIDGTLVRSFLREGGGAEDYDRVEVLPGRREKIMELASVPGSRFSLVTNQGGIAHGYQTVEQVARKIGVVCAEFMHFWSRPLSVHVAAHMPNARLAEWRCEEGEDEHFYRRKPMPGMLLEAMRGHRVDESVTWFVGDMDSDRRCAEAAGVRYWDASEFFER